MQSQDVAANVFNSINLLAIKRSVRLLLDLDTDVIEDFVKKYSAVVIFLLNVLDHERSAALLGRLTDASVMYLVEEELRFLLIREVAATATDPDKMLALTEFLEGVDAPQRPLEPSTIADVLEILALAKLSRKRENLTYLESIPEERLKTILSLLARENRTALYGLLPFSSNEILSAAFDCMLDTEPVLLEALPEGVILRRLREEHGRLREPDAYRRLPDSVRKLLEELAVIHATYRTRLAELDEVTRPRRIELAHAVLSECPENLTDMVLDDLLRTGEIDEKAVMLLRVAGRTLSDGS